MTRTLTVFDLGRMRHLDLLAIWHRLNPDSHTRDALAVARLTTGHLVRAILAST